MARQEPTTPAGATPLERREPGPDLARGAMLLLIALANVHTYFYGRPIGLRGYPQDGHGVDRAVQLLQLVAVDGRVYPLFGLLVGYGLARIVDREVARGTEPRRVRVLLMRRGLALVLVGALHGVLLFSGDIVGAYGLLTVVLAAPVVLRNPFLLAYAAGSGMLMAGLLALSSGLAPAAPRTAMSASRGLADPVAAVAARVGEWLGTGLLLQAFALLPAVAFGAWIAGHGYVGEPAAHRPLLRRVAGFGVAVSVLGGLPLALVATGYWPTPPVLVAVLLSGLHWLSGFVGALGYLALCVLLAGRSGRVAAAVRECGRRSLTCYLAQSVVFVAVLAPYAGGLGASAGVAEAALLAVAVWLGGVVGSVLLARAGRRGPAEVLVRRLTYGRPVSR